MANTRAEYDAGLVLYSIARLSSWSVEGVSYSSMWGKGKTPDGIKAIRAAASTNIKAMYDIVGEHSHASQRRSFKTEAFYQLVRNVYNYRGDGAVDQKAMIDEFCGKYLSDTERSTLPGAAKVNTNSVLSAIKSLI